MTSYSVCWETRREISERHETTFADKKKKKETSPGVVFAEEELNGTRECFCNSETDLQMSSGSALNKKKKKSSTAFVE